MQAIGKKINYIKLHDFLDRIEVEQVYSSLHTFFNTLISQMGPDQQVLWAGKYYSKTILVDLLKEEEGKLVEIIFKEHPSRSFEVDLKFESGNEFVIKIKKQDQYAQIMQFLFDYETGGEAT